MAARPRPHVPPRTGESRRVGDQLICDINYLANLIQDSTIPTRRERMQTPAANTDEDLIYLRRNDTPPLSRLFRSEAIAPVRTNQPGQSGVNRPQILTQEASIASAIGSGNIEIDAETGFIRASDDMVVQLVEIMTPVAVTRGPPLPPLQLSKRQAELAKLPQYTRTVPLANSEQDDETPDLSNASCIACHNCPRAIMSQESPWALKCGHYICHACYTSFKKTKILCKSCRLQSKREEMTKLFL